MSDTANNKLIKEQTEEDKLIVEECIKTSEGQCALQIIIRAFSMSNHPEQKKKAKELRKILNNKRKIN